MKESCISLNIMLIHSNLGLLDGSPMHLSITSKSILIKKLFPNAYNL
jgi:hypothetical protein